MYDLLRGLTVVEGAAFIAGPSCGLYLAQMGATVIRFDQIGGGPDAGRWPLGPTGQSLYWEGLNKGKKSVSLDLSRPAGRELAQRLASAGDGVFITNFPAEGFLSYQRLSVLRSDLICLRVMGWADGTPAVDYTVNAASGVPMMTGPVEHPRPVNHVLPAWDLLAGAYGAFALLAAERDRRASGRGREIRLALSDLAATTLGNLGQVAEVFLGGGDRLRSGNDLFGAFGRDFETADGQRLMIVAITPRQWTGLVKALDIGETVAALEARLDVSFTRDEGARFVHRAELLPLVQAAIGARRADELGPVFDALGVCWSVYRSLAGALATEPRLFTENPLFSRVAHAGGASYPTPGCAARLATDERRNAAPAPRIGADSDEVLASLLGLSDGEIGRLHEQGLVA
ncbi:MAG TPA: CoA transferase [Steroidobacteraceae bacterium]|nr:CoA transferase [Steroidobacteraceae bacterium]